jgi:hypothetical protein
LSEPTILYNGEVKLWFDAAAHSYMVQDGGEPFAVDSVTTILNGALAKPALVQWAANMAVKSVSKDWIAGVAYDKIQIAAALRKAKTAFRSVSKEATDIGSLAHDWIERFIRNEKPEPLVNDAARNCCEAAVKWMMEHKFKIVAVEKRIYSRKYHYAGTMDLMAFVDGHLSVCDWKTGKKVYRESFLQNAAYRQAAKEMGLGTSKQGIIIRLPKKENDPGFEAIPVNEKQSSLLGVFLHTMKVYQWMREE